MYQKPVLSRRVKGRKETYFEQLICEAMIQVETLRLMSYVNVKLDTFNKHYNLLGNMPHGDLRAQVLRIKR